MKKQFLFILLFFIITTIIFSQDFDLKDIPKDIEYCEIIGTAFAQGLAPIITIDFGQKWIAKKAIKRDGKVFSFNSMIDALNWMAQNGWEYVGGYVLLGTPVQYHYILKRKK